MKKTNKIGILTTLSLIFAFSLMFFVSPAKNVKAKEIPVKESLVEGTFEMIDGVSLKLNEDGGIRFKAKMDETVNAFVSDSNVELGFIIAPKQLLQNETNYFAMDKNLKIVADKSKIYFDREYYYANGCITNILPENRELDFVAIAYLLKENKVQYTEYKDTARGNLYDVVNQAILDEYTEDVFSLNSYNAWYGTNDFPILVNDTESYDKLIDIVNESDILKDKKVIVSAGVNHSEGKTITNQDNAPIIKKESLKLSIGDKEFEMQFGQKIGENLPAGESLPIATAGSHPTAVWKIGDTVVTSETVWAWNENKTATAEAVHEFSGAFTPVANDKEHHSQKCSYCDEVKKEVCVYGAKENEDDTNHKQTCSICSQVKTEAHTFVWKKEGNIEKRECKVCSHKDTANSINTVLTGKQKVVLGLSVVDGAIKEDGTIDIKTNLESAFTGNYAKDYTVTKIGENTVENGTVQAKHFKTVTDGNVAYWYGDKSVVVTVKTADKAEHTITVPLTFITQVIKTKADYDNFGTIAKACEVSPTTWGGYFELGNNIVINGNMNEFITAQYDATHGFKGVFDGCGYNLDGVKKTTEKFSAFIGSLSSEGTIKNLSFTHAEYTGTGGAFLTVGTQGNISNVFISYKNGGSKRYTIRNNAAIQVENLFIDASQSEFVYDVPNDNYFKFITEGAVPTAWLVYCVCPTGYSASAADGWKGEHAFASYEALKSNETAWNAVKNFDSAFWSVDETSGKVLPKKLVINNVTKTSKIDLNIKVESGVAKVNTTQEVQFDLSEIPGDYTVIEVNGTAVSDGKAYASVFGFAYGETNAYVTIQKSDAPYYIKVPCLLVSKRLETVTDYNNFNIIAKACESDAHTWGGYFELAQDIEVNGNMNEFIVLGDHYSQLWNESTVDSTKGFKGVFDGCGNTLVGVKKVGAGLSAFITALSSEGVIKNLSFTHAEYNTGASGAFLAQTRYGTIENVYISYSTINSGRCTLQNTNGTVKNVFVDASEATISGGFQLLTSDYKGAWSIYCVYPAGYSGNSADNYGATSIPADGRRSFASYEALKSNETAWNAVKAWDNDFWSVNESTGVVLPKNLVVATRG